MKNAIQIPVYSLTLFASALLLFSVQPIMGKILLPLMGGTPAVWNTAMLFFQLMLLAGYGWAHFAARFVPVRVQTIVQLGLMGLAMLALPISLHGNVAPSPDSSPITWQLGVMLAAVGAPFFVLAATAPMLQRWFAASGHPQAHNPYFLYAASNAGSMAALLLYPFAVEPLLDLGRQTPLWADGFAVLMGLIALSGVFLWMRHPVNPDEAVEKAPPTSLSWRERALWVVLAFIPSSLMLGVTTAITTDIASVPLLWIIPLALYLLTFIVAFARRKVISYDMALWGMTIFLAAALAVTMAGTNLSPIVALLLHCALFFFTAQACHLRLASAQPHADHLTEYYLLISVGGALGGILNGLIAPTVFTSPAEYTLVLLLACLMRRPGGRTGRLLPEKWDDRLFALAFLGLYGAAIIMTVYAWYSPLFSASILAGLLVAVSIIFTHGRRWMFAAVAGLPLLLYPGLGPNVSGKVLHQSRNFFGILKVIDDPKDNARGLIHGTTLHGMQSLDPKFKNTPMSYYHPKTSIADVFKVMGQRRGPQKIAVVGLGTGGLSAYLKSGWTFDFYEIDPAVVAIAKDPKYFTFLETCGAACAVILGDGRLEIAKAANETYDLILLDVFSSDNIPPHIITKEAFGIYLQKLKPDGILAAHLSSRYLDLAPVAGASARDNGLAGLTRFSLGGKEKETGLFYAGTIVTAFARTEKGLDPFRQIKGWGAISIPPDFRTWTDSYTNILAAFRTSIPVLEREEDDSAPSKTSPTVKGE